MFLLNTLFQKKYFFSLLMLGLLFLLSGCSSDLRLNNSNENNNFKEEMDDDTKTINETLNNSLNSGFFERKLKQGNLERTYYIYIPETIEENTATIFNFHGGFGNGKRHCESSNIFKTADEFGFIVVCPDGTSSGRRIGSNLLYWNDGQINTPAQRNSVDDVGFVELIISDLKQSWNIDKNRIYATGLSNGAIFSYRLACELSDKIAAIAPVAGAVGDMVESCKPKRQVPMIIFHGLKDTNIPIDGGVGSGFSGHNFSPFSDARTMCFKINNIDENDLIDSGEVGNAKYESYGKETKERCIFWTLDDVGHTWPGANKNISASEEMWNFFKNHTLFTNN